VQLEAKKMNSTSKKISQSYTHICIYQYVYMRERRERKRTCIREDRTINGRGLIMTSDFK
jgi:hypothetical protein